jgi:predicted  nucleic acid-binding Zn-ribbon protein
LRHIDTEVSEMENIQSTLQRAAARRRWLRGWNGLWRGFFAGSLVWLAALALFKLAPVPSSVLPGAAALAAILTLAGFLHGWFHKPSLQQTARWVDENQRLQERLSTALELGVGAANDNWRALLVADAARFAARLDPRKLLPCRLPRVSLWALAALALGAGLGFVPEFRTKAYLQKQQDALAVKQAGRLLLDLTRHDLEHRAPLLPPTRQSLEAVQELALKLDKVALTRGEALKDLANAADKIKAEARDLGLTTPALNSLEKTARDAARAASSSTAQKEIEALQKSLGKSADNPEALEKLAADLQSAQKALADMPKGDTPGAGAARQQMSQTLSDLAQQARELGQPLPNLDDAIAALQNSQMDSLQKDLDAATTDLNKLKETAQTLRQLQQQADRKGKDLPEQLQFGQADAAQQTMQRMINMLKSGAITADQAAKTLDEVARSVQPAGPYGNASDFLKQAAQQLRSGQNPAAAQSLADASKELEKTMAQMEDAKALDASLAALQKAELCLGQSRNPGNRPGRPSGKPGAGRSGVGTWTPDDSQLYPEMSGSWDNTGITQPDKDPRGLTDRGDPQLADNLNPTKFKAQLIPGGPMPSINLKGVSIKGQSTVAYQQAAATAQSDAQSALNQDQVPRAYQGAVRNYFDDLK